MHPQAVGLGGIEIAVWDLAFLIGLVIGYAILRQSLPLRTNAPLPRLLLLRWIATAYVSAIGAQLFAYLFDLNTSAVPPPAIGWARYYFDPLFGPKTLYGAIVLLPLTAFAISVPWGDLGYEESLDAWTPPMFAVLAACRVGCFLQGCCYGVRSDVMGVSFPIHGSLYYEQLRDGLISAGSPTLPVIPTQLVSAVVLIVLCLWSLGRLRRGRTGIFPHAVALYSLFRFAVEFIRDDPDRNFLGPLSTSQWIAVAILLVYVAWRGTRGRMVIRARGSLSAS
jgi:phosphatidylglycerol:prolipoprotein diacylglycerol transferase